MPYAKGANVPDQDQALWFYSQMVRWGQVEASPERAAIAAASYRAQIFHNAIPDAAARAHTSRFFDGRPFDPGSLDAYIAEQTNRDLSIS